jgi:hypothetical protein
MLSFYVVLKNQLFNVPPKVHSNQQSPSLAKLNKQTENIFSISFLNNCNFIDGKLYNI